MKYRIITLITLFAVIVSHPAAAQIRFTRTGDLNELLKQAKAENKYVFIDGYTDWCGWCKELDKKVFTTPEIGEIADKYFIATKFEMEKDSIGIMLAKKYAVNSFPTILIIDGNGNLVNLVKGYSNAPEYGTRLLKAIEPANHIPAGAFSNTYDLDYPQLYNDLFPAAGRKKIMPDSVTINQYLQSQPDLTTEVNWVVMNRFYFRLNDELFDQLIKNKQQFDERYGKVASEELIGNIISAHASQCSKRNDYTCLLGYLDKLEKYVADGKAQRTYYIENFYAANKNWDKLAQHINSQLGDSAYKNNISNLNDKAWSIYENSNDSFALQSAVNWMKIVLKKEPATYMYLDTYAALLYKIKQYNDAEKFAERAIAAGKETKENVKETEALLVKIKEAKTHTKKAAK